MSPGSPRGSLLRDLAGTSVVQLLTITMNAVSLAVIARRLGDTELGQYALQRRAMALLQPFILLGLTVAVPRYLGASSTDRDGDRNAYAVGGLAVVLVSSGVVTAVMLLAPGSVALLAFGDRGAVELARALSGFVFAMALYQVVYSIFRGWIMVAWSNALELLAVGAFPLGLALFGPRSIDALIWALNGGILVTAIAFAALGLHARLRTDLATVLARLPRLLRFGIVRTPGDLAVVALFSLGPLMVVHAANSTQAGYASIVQSSLNLVSIAAVPLSTLLLPRAAADHAAGLARGAPKYRLLWAATIDASLGVCGLLVVASPLVMTAWLSDVPDGLVLAQQIAALGIPGYIVYLVFRSLLDATHVRPYSSIATLCGLAALVACLAGGLVADLDPLRTASAATAVALSVTGLVIWRVTSSELEIGRPERCTALLLGWLAASIVAAAIVGPGLVAAAATSAVAALAYGAIVLVVQPAWYVELLSRLPTGRLAAP